MGFLSWLHALRPRGEDDSPHPAPDPPSAGAPAAPPASNAWPGPDWEPLAPYLPVDPHDHLPVCIAATAIAAGDRPTSDLTVTRVSLANPEYQRVTLIASALAAGALPESTFAVTRIYKKSSPEETHAA